MRRKSVISSSLRKAVVDRDNGLCRACGCDDTDSLQADHIVPESRGGETSLDNLQALCGVCNNRKGNTIIGALPIRQPLADTLSHREYKQSVADNRVVFLEMLASKRSEEIDRLTRLVILWRSQNVREVIIRNRLGKMVEDRKVDSIVRRATI